MQTTTTTAATTPTALTEHQRYLNSINIYRKPFKSSNVREIVLTTFLRIESEYVLNQLQRTYDNCRKLVDIGMFWNDITKPLSKEELKELYKIYFDYLGAIDFQPREAKAAFKEIVAFCREDAYSERLKNLFK